MASLQLASIIICLLRRTHILLLSETLGAANALPIGIREQPHLEPHSACMQHSASDVSSGAPELCCSDLLYERERERERILHLQPTN